LPFPAGYKVRLPGFAIFRYVRAISLSNALCRGNHSWRCSILLTAIAYFRRLAVLSHLTTPQGSPRERKGHGEPFKREEVEQGHDREPAPKLWTSRPLFRQEGRSRISHK